MFKKVISWLLILSFVASLWVADGYVECNCDDDDDAYWSINTLLFVQRGSDLCIAVAYFSIPIEIIYFVSCSNYFPFKWVLFEFGAFIIFCGLTHFLTFVSHSGQQTFHLLVALLVSKILTALISLCTAISLVTLFPLLLKFKTREYMLLLKNRDLDQEVRKIKQKEETGMHVRMLTQEIRKSLDRHTILYTTLVELSKILNLENCVIWMPNENRTEMRLTHDPTTRENVSGMYNTMPISTSDPDVKEINGSDDVKILDACSPLAAASSRESFESESVAAIRIPMLKVSNFRGGTPEIVPQCYAILVLVQPGGRFWRSQEIEIVRAAADQVAVALSHAAVVEESQHMSERLMEQNRALTKAREDALRASQASNAFQTVMSNRLGRPLHSILSLLSLLQDEKLRDERQQLLVDSTVKTSNVLSTLIGDVIVSSTKDNMRFPLDVRHFQLHSFIREAACVTKCLCTFKGYNITIEVDRYLPNHVMGDDKRFFHVLLRIVGNLLDGDHGGRRHLTFRVLPASENDVSWKTRRSNSSRDNVYIKFEFCTSISRSQSKTNLCSPTYSSTEVDQESFNFAVCRKLVKLMQGEIFVVRNSEGFDQSVVVIVGFQRLPSIPVGISEYGKSSNAKYSLLHGVRVVLADHDDLNRAVTRKMLEKLGCIVTVVSFGFECIGAISPDASALQVILMDLHLPDVDGFEVTTRLGKHQSQNRPLIIGLAAATADEDVTRKCLQIGMSGIIHKPVLLPGLADELQKALLRASRVMP